MGADDLPALIQPMLAVAGAMPTAADDAAWGYEIKWDGVRAVAYLDGAGGLRLMSRTDRDITVRYPETAGLVADAGAMSMVLDGEMIAFDERGRPSFTRLQHRMHITDPAEAARLTGPIPVTFMLFDVLFLAGRSTLTLPYTDRRELLDGLQLGGDHWQTPPTWRGGGADVRAATKAQGLEGVVAKRLDSTYLPGRRAPAWRKVKNLHTQDVIVGGWTLGEGKREGTIGALLVGVPTPDGLAFVGHVGTGFSGAVLDELSRRLAALATEQSPFDAVEVPREYRRRARWARPELVGEVAYAEFTPDGRLRHPRWRGLRADVSPEAVRWDPEG